MFHLGILFCLGTLSLLFAAMIVVGGNNVVIVIVVVLVDAGANDYHWL